MRLTAEEGRVLGALVEKELTTPQGYPLTDSALLAACNQTTSREPVVAYDLGVLRRAVRSLREQGLLRTVHRPGERSEKHRHELPAAVGLSAEQVVVLAVLLLRGPQTAAELRARSERMQVLSGEQVDRVLDELAARGLAQRLERQPGRKEPRWVQLLTLADEPPAAAAVEEPVRVATAVLAALNAATAARDVAAALDLFTPDAVLLGSSAEEQHLGRDALEAFLRRFFAGDGTIGWEGEDLTVGEHAGVVWVLLVGEAVLTGSQVERWPYRLSLVLVPSGGRHRIAQLHGSEPSD